MRSLRRGQVEKDQREAEVCLQANLSWADRVSSCLQLEGEEWVQDQRVRLIKKTKQQNVALGVSQVDVLPMNYPMQLPVQMYYCSIIDISLK